MISICLIGAGNVGSFFYNAIEKAENYFVKQWYNRSINKISSYKDFTNITDSLNELEAADLYIICVNDDSIAEVSSALPFENKLVAHTSGAVNIKDLDRKNERGVFYPLQSFTKGRKLENENIPLCIEVLEKKNSQLLKDLAEALGCPNYMISTAQRQTLHASAVFVNNFTNHLYTLANEISSDNNIEFDILKPLIRETANKLEAFSPYKSQTGPALRNDKKTIEKHLKLIEKKSHQDIYKLLTASIQQTHGN